MYLRPSARCWWPRRSTAPAKLTRAKFAQFESTRANASLTSPLLGKIREDLKSAMRAKDKPRLNVIRTILNESASAEKKDVPLQTDIQILNILKKRIKMCEEAVTAAAGRPDLQAKEEAEIAVLKEYASQVQTISPQEIGEAVDQAVQKLKDLPKMQPGMVLKELFRPGGLLDGKPVEKSEVAKVVQKSLESGSGC